MNRPCPAGQRLKKNRVVPWRSLPVTSGVAQRGHGATSASFERTGLASAIDRKSASVAPGESCSSSVPSNQRPWHFSQMSSSRDRP
jgi:hypothetical protein